MANTHLNFGAVIEALKNGKRVSREGWNGKGMYLWLLPKSEVKREWVKDPHLLAAFGDKDTLECGYCIRMRNAQGTIDTWHPSIPDLFAEDWQIID